MEEESFGVSSLDGIADFGESLFGWMAGRGWQTAGEAAYFQDEGDVEGVEHGLDAAEYDSGMDEDYDWDDDVDEAW